MENQVKELQELLLQSDPEIAIEDKGDSEEEDNIEEMSDNQTEEETDETTDQPSGRSLTICDMNRFKWSVTPPKEKRRRTHQKDYVPELLDAAKDKNSPMEMWSLLFTDEMLHITLKYTNAEISRRRECFANDQTYISDMDIEELKAFIGILYFCGTEKNNHANIRKLWGPLASFFYRSTMPRARFEFLLQCLRFDDRNTRVERRQCDKLAPIRDLWDLLIKQCTKYYSPSKHITIDEQLLNFRGRCAFRIYIPSKPEKYGIKIVMMNDAQTYYMINAIPYIGKVDTVPIESVPSYYVRKLSEPIHNSHRNITCDNWFTSVPLVQNMKNNFSLTMVGTIKKNESEIPLQMRKFTTVHDSRFLHADNMTLLSYCPKRNKIVLLLSSLHQQGKVQDQRKPNIIEFYNSTKGGTDTFDHMCHEYTTARASNRWPTRFFYGMLDQIGINSFILYTLNENNNKMKRLQFIETLAVSLITPFIKRRLHCQTIIRPLRMLMESVIGIECSESYTHDPIDFKLDKRVRCTYCPVHRDRKTQFICPQCTYPRCEEHRSMLCNSCGLSKF